MNIIGISNPGFVGVTVATKAICTDWIGVDQSTRLLNVANEIHQKKPDIVIIGGWSPRFEELVTYLDGLNICSVWHGTMFHDQFFNDQSYYNQMLNLYNAGIIKSLGYAHPGMADYESYVHDRNAFFLPHWFPQNNPVRNVRSVHIVGMKNSLLKNAGGQIQIALDYAAKNNIAVTYDSGPMNKEDYLNVIKSSGLVLHLSHLECFPNTILEAWSYGIPCIFGPAARAIIDSPACRASDKKLLKCMLPSSSEPLYLYRQMDEIFNDYDAYQKAVVSYSRSHSRMCEAYTKSQLETICESFTSRRIP